jgi:HEAT repeat protein
MLLVATCGLVIWSALRAREALFPVHHWSRQLRYGNLEQRREALGVIASLKGGNIVAAIPVLGEALRDEDETLATGASWTMRQAIGFAQKGGDADATRTAYRALIAASRDSRAIVRKLAIGGLGGSSLLDARTTEETRDTLLAAIGDEDEGVRGVAVGSLAVLVSEKPNPLQEKFLTILRSDPAPSVRASAAHALGSLKWGRDQTTLALLHTLETDEPLVRDQANMVLNGMRNPFRPGFPPRTAAIVPELIAALKSNEPRVRVQAISILEEMGPAASASIPELLRMTKEPVHAETTHPGKIEPSDRDLSSLASVALGRIAPGTPQAPEVVAALIDVLRTETVVARQASAAVGLSGFGADVAAPAVPVLLELLSKNANRTGAPSSSLHKALGSNAPCTPWADRAIAVLTRALDSKELDTYYQAAESLGKFGPRASAALPRLHTLEKNERIDFVKRAIATAILQIEDPQAGSIQK